MSKLPVFNPSDLKPVREFCADGTLPFHWKTAERFCRTGIIPAVKVGNEWRTNLAGVRHYFWSRANKAFQKIHS
jgi:hypothetical protein